MNLVEKYRPSSFSEVRGQSYVVQAIQRILRRKEGIPHMLFIGSPGVGKTTIAHLIAKELKCPIRELNASDERGIDVIRGDVKRLSRISGRRIILLDEADNLTNDAQQALRRIMETTKSSIFILTGNHEYRIIDPIKSRCAIFRFERLTDEDVLRRVLEICRREGIQIQKKEPLIRLVKNSHGDLRKALNTLEHLITEGKDLTEENISRLEGVGLEVIALEKALGGNFEEAKNLMEDASLKFNHEEIIERLYERIGSVKELELRTKLYIKLAEVEHRCKTGSNPLIQLVNFMAWAWILPHLPQGCPLKGGSSNADA